MEFGVYLAGTFEKRLGVFTQFQIVNPTANDLKVRAVFFDETGALLHSIAGEVRSNGMWEVDMNKFGASVPVDHGVAKFFSLRDDKLAPGIVGLQRRLAAGPVPNIDYAAFAESNLAAIPTEVAEEDYRTLG
jgi:hypothetical protein